MRPNFTKKKIKEKKKKNQLVSFHLSIRHPPDPCRNISFVVVSTDSTAIALLLPFTFKK